jgi:hypothetical protein
MELYAGFILGFSHILPIIPKSNSAVPRISQTVSNPNQHRVLMASIRDKGYCPCPRCLIPRSRFQNLGMTQDMKQRGTLVRIDDESRRSKVDTAREIIYEKNYAVNSRAVDDLLMEQSLVPTLVSSKSDVYDQLVQN